MAGRQDIAESFDWNGVPQRPMTLKKKRSLLSLGSARIPASPSRVEHAIDHSAWDEVVAPVKVEDTLGRTVLKKNSGVGPEDAENYAGLGENHYLSPSEIESEMAVVTPMVVQKRNRIVNVLRLFSGVSMRRSSGSSTGSDDRLNKF